MRLSDQPRGQNRAKINRLMNGNPPWSSSEQEAANIKTNVNFLDGAKLAADARRSFHNAFLKPGAFFSVTLDAGPVYKRSQWGRTITRELNRVMKRSRDYLELLRSQFASVVLHGIGPALWCDREHWCPESVGVEDLMIPSNTLLTLKNLDYFAVFRQYTAKELWKKTHGPRRDPGWNMDLVDAAIRWADQQAYAQQSYTELYSPEKVEERFKQDLGFYGTDSIPTIDLWDFYFWDDESKQSGWRRRMVLDTPMYYQVGEARKAHAKMPDKNLIDGPHGAWLYNPGERVFADNVQEILHLQFGDCSAVAPFRYHSVRSLGWLLYAVCHIQNRLKCKLNDHIFENLLQYFRAAGAEDHERLAKLDLQNLSVIPDGVNFVPQAERWQINESVVTLGLGENKQSMQEAAAQYREGRQSETGREKTATEIMANVNAANALVGAMLLLSYEYARFQYQEIARRFCKKNSVDQDVRTFRNNVLKAGVPEKVLDSSLWNVEPERVLGAGNKMLEVAAADKLMGLRPLLDPDAQREVVHLNILANSDNPDLANRLAPLEGAQVTDSIHDAQLMIGTLMEGVRVMPKRGQNPTEIIETLIAGMAAIMKRIEAEGSMAAGKEIIGLRNIAATIQGYMQFLAEDEDAKDKLKEYGDALGKMMNIVKAYGQRLVEQTQAQQQQGGNGGVDPKDAAKVQAMQIQAQVKAANTRESHAQRTAQRQVQFEQKMKQDDAKHRAEMQKMVRETMTNTAAKDIETASAVRRGRMKSTEE